MNNLIFFFFVTVDLVSSFYCHLVAGGGRQLLASIVLI